MMEPKSWKEELGGGFIWYKGRNNNAAAIHHAGTCMLTTFHRCNT